MGERLTCLGQNDLKRFYACRLNEWLPEWKSEYQSYNFFKKKLQMNKNVKLFRETEIIYIKVAEYVHNGIEFDMVLDLNYDITDFLVKNENKVDVIRELIEDIIQTEKNKCSESINSSNNKLIEYTSKIAKEKTIIFDFSGFDKPKDFDTIEDIIKRKIKPKRFDVKASFDAVAAYFDKDGLKIEIVFDPMMGNTMKIVGEKTISDMEKVRIWAKMIFDHLIACSSKSRLTSNEVLEYIPITELVDILKLPENPAAGSMSHYQSRIWYKWQVGKMVNRLDYSKPLNQVAREAISGRNELKETALELMSDRSWAELFAKNDKCKTFDDIAEHFIEKGLAGDELWYEIIESSKRTPNMMDRLFKLED